MNPYTDWAASPAGDASALLGRSMLTPAGPLIERALLGDGGAAADLIRRLTAGDVALAMAVAAPANPAAERVRMALLEYLTLGSWEGQILPLPAGCYAGREGQRLRDLIVHAVFGGAPAGWQAALLERLRDPDPRLRRTAVGLLAGCPHPAALTALVTALADRDEGVRWAAAMALCRQDGGAEALLRRLAGRDLVPELRHVAAYVLRHVSDMALRQKLVSVVQALDSSDYQVAGPLAAGAALRALGLRQPLG